MTGKQTAIPFANGYYSTLTLILFLDSIYRHETTAIGRHAGQ